MSSLVYDRLTGTAADSAALPLLLGRCQLHPPTSSAAVLNGVTVETGDYLVPDRRGGFLLRINGEETASTFVADQFPEELDAGSIIAIGTELEELCRYDATWSDWRDVAPLVPGMSKRVMVQPFEHHIGDQIGALQAVCQRPRAHLRVEIDRVAAARARRLPAQALAYLAAHTEDWELPTVRGVRPRRVLALVPEDQLDIYENRVAARLVDHLDAYLLQRIYEVRRLERMFLEAANYGQQAALGSHWRQRRIFTLWGNAMDANEGALLAKSTLRVLRRLQHKTAGLKDSPLYRAVPRRTQISTTLTQTNILVSDPLYGRVARLWLLWAQHGHRQPRSPAQFYADQQALCRSFTAFVSLLVVHALDQLGYAPGPDTAAAPLDRGEAVAIEGPDGRYKLRWDDEDTLTLLAADGQTLLRIVPLSAMLQGLLGEHSSDVDAIVGGLSPGTLVLYPSALAGTSAMPQLPSLVRLNSLGNDYSDRRIGAGFLSVSPWEIASVERVARALRWALMGPRLLAYPPMVERTPDAAPLGDGVSWLRIAEGGKHWLVLRPPRIADLAQLGMDDALDRAQQVVRAFSQDRETVQQDRRGSRDDRRELSALNQEKRLLQHRLTAAEATCAALDRSKASLDAALPSINALLRCPVCEQFDPDPYRGFQVQDKNFRCTCAGCQATWGTQTCVGCRRRFAFLWPNYCLPPEDVLPRAPGWVDELVGCDVLAVPCPSGPGPEPKYVCPSCGGCPCCRPV